MLLYAVSRIRKLERAVDRLAVNLSQDAQPTSPQPLRGLRRWLTFRMSTLLIATAMVACLMAVFAREYSESKRQAAAVDQLTQVGATVTAFGSLPDPPQASCCGFTSDPESDIPSTWVHYLFGNQFGRRAHSVSFSLTASFYDSMEIGALGCSDKDVSVLSDLRDLRNLSLDHTSITDDALVHFAAVTTLQRLALRNTSIDGSGFRHLDNLQNLRHLDLRGTNFHEDHVPKLCQFSGLESVCLPRQANDRWLEILSDCQSLKTVDFENTEVTPAGIDSLEKLPQLSCLLMNKVCCEASAIDRLRSIKSLRILRLNNDQLTLEDLAAVTRLKQIKDLDLGNYIYSVGDKKVKALLTSMQQLSVLRLGFTVAGAGGGFGANEDLDFSLPNGLTTFSRSRAVASFDGGFF